MNKIKAAIIGSGNIGSDLMIKLLKYGQYIEIAAKAGYDGIELWTNDIKEYLKNGNKLSDLAKIIDSAGLKVENAIGFAPWMVSDNEKRRLGLIQLEEEMNWLAALGGKRIAAPPAGVGRDEPIDWLVAGLRYKAALAHARGSRCRRHPCRRRAPAPAWSGAP